MVTYAPLPAWKDLGAALIGSDAPSDDKLSGPWCAAGRRGAWYSRGAFALRAIARRQRAAGGRRDPVVWLPDYFCNQSTAPLRADGARLAFYPVTGSAAVDWTTPFPNDMPPPDLVMAVHHFGWPADMAGAIGFARGIGAVLIEDAAHAVGPADGIGTAGDFVLFCPRKIFAIPDGAVLIAPANEVGRLTAESGSPAPDPASWQLKRAVQKILPDPLLSAWIRSRQPAFDDDAAFASLPETPALSRMARLLLGRLLGRLDAEAQARRHHWHTLAELFSDRTDARPFWNAWPWQRAAPYRFIVQAQNHATARSLYRRLGNAGIPVETWPDLAPEVTAHPRRHHEAIALRRTVLLLPVHGGVGIEKLSQRIRWALR